MASGIITWEVAESTHETGSQGFFGDGWKEHMLDQYWSWL